ncbi:MAG: hypothetical protein H6Q61_608 [Firmicutes bacterium]|nr:hypothetical protein [Bacillota bacterium]
MFGYVRPYLDRLPEEDRERYRAAYCGLCHAIGKRYGRLPQLFLNYDFTFLAILLAKNRETPCINCRRCSFYPIRKRESWQEDVGLELAADESVILTYWKLRDNVQDAGFFKSIPLRFLTAWFGFPYRKARSRCPDFDRVTEACLLELRQMEEAGCDSIDRTADAFARILQAASGIHGQAGSEALGQLLYHVGRWIYLVDAWDDLEEDLKHGNYNPLLSRYGEAVYENRETVRETMYASLGLAQGAYEWLDCGVWSPILENILTLGLPAMEEAVLSGEWKTQKKSCTAQFINRLRENGR